MPAIKYAQFHELLKSEYDNIIVSEHRKNIFFGTCMWFFVRQKHNEIFVFAFLMFSCFVFVIFVFRFIVRHSSFFI